MIRMLLTLTAESIVCSRAYRKNLQRKESWISARYASSQRAPRVRPSSEAPDGTAEAAVLPIDGLADEGFMDRAHCFFAMLEVDHDGDFDFAGGDHVDVHAVLRERFEHFGCDARMAAHADANDG